MFQFIKVATKTLVGRVARNQSFTSVFSKSKLEELPSAIRFQLSKLSPNGKVFKWETLKDGRTKIRTKDGTNIITSFFDKNNMLLRSQSWDNAVGTYSTTYKTPSNSVWVKQEYKQVAGGGLRCVSIRNSHAHTPVCPNDADMFGRVILGGTYWGGCELPKASGIGKTGWFFTLGKLPTAETALEVAKKGVYQRPPINRKNGLPRIFCMWSSY